MKLTWRRADGAVCPRVEKGTDYHYIAGEFTQKVYDKLATYEDAEEQGRLVILPCKVGDPVFRVVPKCSASYIWCPFNGGYGLDRCNNCDAFIKEESFCFSMFEDIGKTVFFTREDAEAALNGGHNDASNT